jgi:hypothetical protein
VVGSAAVRRAAKQRGLATSLAAVLLGPTLAPAPTGRDPAARAASVLRVHCSLEWAGRSPRNAVRDDCGVAEHSAAAPPAVRRVEVADMRE